MSDTIYRQGLPAFRPNVMFGGYPQDSDYDDPDGNGVLSSQVMWRRLAKLSQHVVNRRFSAPSPTAREAGRVDKLDAQRLMWRHGFDNVVLAGD